MGNQHGADFADDAEDGLETLLTACALMFMEGAGEGTRVSFAFLRRRVERRGRFNFLDIAIQNFK